MKRISCTFLFLLSTIFCCAQDMIKVCELVDGCWSKWRDSYEYIYGNYGQFQFYKPEGHPSIFCWRFTINNYRTPTRAEIEKHRTTGEWFEYSGTFEYYISDDFPDIRSQLLKPGMVAPWLHDTSKGQTPCVKRTVNATIKIEPYVEHPKVYNVFFEGCGYGIDLCDTQLRQ
jgi:hypothetical protein